MSYHSSHYFHDILFEMSKARQICIPNVVCNFRSCVWVRQVGLGASEDYIQFLMQLASVHDAELKLDEVSSQPTIFLVSQPWTWRVCSPICKSGTETKDPERCESYPGEGLARRNVLSGRISDLPNPRP